MKTCECGNTIPTSVKIDGKRRNLCNRVKCLTCVPFGSSQFRKKTHDEYRSRKAREARDRYVRNKSIGVEKVKTFRTQRKQSVITALGGKCQLCGYVKLDRNLAFHHLGDKKFDLSSRTFQFSWDKILPELLKCVLVCHNCHGEIHGGIIDQATIETKNREVKELLKDFNGP